MPALVAPSQPPILLLEVEVGSDQPLRFAERPCVVGTGTAAVRFVGGLSAEILDEIELTADGPPTRQVALQLGSETSWVALTPHLGRARARLYWWGGGELDTAELMMTGQLDEPVLADPEVSPGVGSFSLVEREGDDRGLLVETAMVGDATFPALNPSGVAGDGVPDAYAGTYYPEVIGRPGYPFPAWFTAEGVAPGSPAHWGQHHTGGLYAAGTSIIAKRGVSRVATVRAWDSEGATEPVDLVTMRDLRGQSYTAIDMATVATLVAPATAADVSTGWAIGWTDVPTTGPGGALRGLGDVIVWALERAGVDLPDANRGRAWDIDWARTLDCRGSLNRFKIDTYIAEQVGVWEWLSRDVLPFFPVFVGRSGRGLYVSEWRYQARRSEAVLELEQGRNAHRISAVSSQSKGDAYTEIALKFGLTVRSGKHIREAPFSGGAVAGRTDVLARHPFLERLYGVSGLRSTEFAIPVVWDLGSGYELGEYLCARYAAPLREVWYRLPWQLSGVYPGMVVTAVDEEAGVDAVGTITGRRPGPGCLDVRVLVHP